MMSSSLKFEESSGQLQHVAIEELFWQGIDAGDVKKLKDAGIVTCNGLMMQTLTGIEGLSEVDKICKAAVKLLNSGYVTESDAPLKANTCCSVPEVFCRIKDMLELLEGDILKKHDNFGCQSAENKYKQSLLDKDERIEILKGSIEIAKNVAKKRMEELIYSKEELEEQHKEFVEKETMYNQLLEKQGKEIVQLKKEIMELLTQSAENKDKQSKVPDKDKQSKEPDKDKQIEILKGSIELIKSVLNTKSKELRDAKQELEKQNKEFVQIRTVYNQLLEDQHKENVQLKKEKVELKKEIMELKKETVEKERDCKERIREEMKTELEDKDNEILSAKELIKMHTTQLNNVNKKIHKLKDENKKTKEVITALKEENSNAKVVITNLKEENNNLKEENNNLKEENNNLKEEKNNLKEENNNLKEEIISRKESIPAIFHIRK